MMFVKLIEKETGEEVYVESNHVSCVIPHFQDSQIFFDSGKNIAVIGKPKFIVKQLEEANRPPVVRLDLP